VDQPGQLVRRRATRPGRRRLLSADLPGWLTATFGRLPADIAPYQRALTHGSQAAENYERLEFLGDRVLGLVMAEWLWELFPKEPEGNLSKRLNALVTGAVCADIARELGVRAHLKLGKQARDDGAYESDNILGDVLEALIGAWYIEAGLDGARSFIRAAWGARVQSGDKAPQHPKSALQEWAAAAGRRTPEYVVVDRSGPQHAPRFTVQVKIGTFAEASATGANKQIAETAAAKALLAKLTA
jgi:ribonuclease-3